MDLRCGLLTIMLAMFLRKVGTERSVSHGETPGSLPGRQEEPGWGWESGWGEPILVPLTILPQSRQRDSLKLSD